MFRNGTINLDTGATSNTMTRANGINTIYKRDSTNPYFDKRNNQMVEDEVEFDMGAARSDFDDDSEGDLYMTKQNRNQMRIDALANKYGA